jgi:phospholipid transport system substrate-binding protein
MLIPARRTVLAMLLAMPLTARAQQGDPAAPIEALDKALLDAMRAGRATPFPDRFKMLAPTIDAAFDLPEILRNSVGLRWQDMSTDQRSALEQVFRVFTIASYAANFDNFDGQRIEILPERRSIGADQVIATNLIQGEQATRIDYVMRQTGGTWRAIDVLLNGTISRVAVQRSDFRRLLDSGNAERLIQSLRDKVAELSGGTVTA